MVRSLADRTFQLRSLLGAAPPRSPRRRPTAGIRTSITWFDAECLAINHTIVTSAAFLDAPETYDSRGASIFLEGSFSVVSKPNVASKYAFESSRRDLHNALLCTALKSQLLE